jgi:serine/threonine-protein kinase
MNLPPTAPAELAPGRVIAGKFRLERAIGRGGMGAVWAARQILLDMPVALKFIDAEDGADLEDARARFEREARATGAIRSPHVVQILDHGIDGERPYIVMELLEGEDLGERLGREGRLGLTSVARIVGQAAKALRRAHEAGIIHRDLKPGNVFLARFDDDEVVKILDFGVAKMSRPGSIDEPLVTRTGIVFGSPSYMSPEQARGSAVVDHRTDLWSLAVIVFRALTGVKPFQGDSLADLVVKVCFDPLPVASQIAPDLPPALDAFFERGFARDPEQRFSSAIELAGAFAAVVVEVSGALPSLPRQAPGFADGRSFAGDPISGAHWSPPGFAPDPGAARGAGGSGPHVGFAPGTLTPPPRLSGYVDPTPASGGSLLPSGAALAPTSVGAHGEHTGVPPPLAPASPGSSVVPSATLGPSRAAVVFAACAAVATLVIAFAALVSLGRTPAPAALGASASVAEPASAAPASPETPSPPASASAGADPSASAEPSASDGPAAPPPTATVPHADPPIAAPKPRTNAPRPGSRRRVPGGR